MDKAVPWAIAAFGVLVVGLQFWPTARTNPPARFEGAIVAPDTEPVIRAACYDCHSNRTRWPWYSEVQPVKFLLVRDVEEGRKELNIDTWDTVSLKRRIKILRESAEEIEEGKMPPAAYVLTHPEARLDRAQRQKLVDEFLLLAAAQR